MTLLYVYTLCAAACVDFFSADPHVNISAKVGSTVVLPCNLTDMSSQTPLVRWRANNKVVFEQSIDNVCMGVEYKGRVDVPENELYKGNCSLVLKNVRLIDDNFYNSFVVEHADRSNTDKWRKINKVELSVHAMEISAQVGSTVILPCAWSSQSIQTPHVEWYIDSEIVFERKARESFPGEGYEDRVDVPEDELHKGNCSLVLKNVSFTDQAVYRSLIVLQHQKKDLAQKVKLSVTMLKKDLTRSDEAAINLPHPLILIISLLVCLLFSSQWELSG